MKIEYETQSVLSNVIKVVKIGFCALKQHFDLGFKKRRRPAAQSGYREGMC